VVDAKVKEANKHAISRAAGIRKWRILPIGFSVIGGELTPTLKLKRNVVVEKYDQEIREFYG
jgi:long-subunit acyl-CoA synthetase (AMP-forming)